MTSSIVLYSYFRSSTSYRVRIGLNLKGLSYDYIPVNLIQGGGDQYTDSYKKINPSSGVPAIIYNGKPIGQSLAILEYLNEMHPLKVPFLPQDPYARAKIRQICENINADSHPLQNVRVVKYLDQKFGISDSERSEFVRHWIVLGLNAVEKILSETAGTFCFGGEVSMADIVLIPQLFSANRFSVDLTNYPICQRIAQTCANLPAFANAHPFRQPDCPPDLAIN